ncbi:hypothetical protein BOTBODRAFT_181369 [Botryobasidium botryosum FD-172 SS1]|uniref:RNA polymerase Rpb1 domain-containing protein n=1 Tax=Botryobasidium botryosum (strain FD-172 SS1) TaxID=930990 RepID=A0A067LTP2_BOTB1|nr:hypothetical protein BOTBODRAFT_181369 [Botryobasidium botryosum FD-172 SS1]
MQHTKHTYEPHGIYPAYLHMLAAAHSCLFCLDVGMPELQAKLDEEFNQLKADRWLLRKFVFKLSDPANTHYLPVNLHRIIQNAQQIFHIDCQKASDLSPTYIVEAVQKLLECLIII